MSEGRSGGPAIWLAVETATASGSVALWKEGLAVELTLRVHGSGAERLLPAIEQVLESTGTRPEEVTSFIVGSGPGSFTGVRIAASMAKGWAMARRTELFAYPSLLAVAAGWPAGGPVCSLFDARRGQVYAACYEVSDVGLQEHLPPGAWKVEALVAELDSRGLSPVFAGEGALVYAKEIGTAVAGATILPAHLAVPRAASLLWLRQLAPDLGRVAKPQDWEPTYVRDWKVQEGRGKR
ncbi:MAG TPA: tRNA (adenosine(37)-N6)-threonylcarbamoyltransferase complex dimerization subunit type 1 TsaB [Gemmatimonadota bacterium]|nr:tRNA (adenosine(37)-N6)-threonylcarbamoyltransferase complex dimerization subunit type 1 TsaB [Gemmatimonadota bacterium]